MANAVGPYIWLGPRWDAWLEFGPENSRARFEAIARRLKEEFGATVLEALPNPAEDGKEYVWLQVGRAAMLLMRKAGCGVGLSAGYRDLPELLRIGAAFGASRQGWRWPLYHLWNWITRQPRY
ncbi:MAG: hypothetical protein U0793_34110 [Gemmataceae bacterium]